MIDWYRARWEIEMFFHVLKNGCRIEALQLGCVDKLERALVLYMVVAWRIARLMRLGRSCPELDAQLMFEPDEWQAAYILNKKKLPDKPPTLNAFRYTQVSRACSSRENLMPAAKSRMRCMPSQMVLTPGSPSPVRARKPPSLATRRTTSLSVGGLSGNFFLFRM